MLDFMYQIIERRIEIYKSETAKEKQENTSNNASSFNVGERYLEVLNLSVKVKLLCKEGKICKTTKKMMNRMEAKMNNLFRNYVITSKEIEFDDILALAIAYFNLSYIYMNEKVNFNTAKDHLIKCTELLKGKELDSKVILIAIHVLINLHITWKKLGQLENCYPLLDKALELYLNYTKEEDEYPDPPNIDVLHYITDEIINPKIFLIELHKLTLESMKLLYYLQPGNMHKFVIYIHNLLNKHLKTIENSTEYHMFIYWAKASTDLSMYFLHHDRFMEAKIHLAAAEYMITMSYILSLTNSDDSESLEFIDEYNQINAHITKLWGIYGIMFLHSSKERLLQYKNNRSCEANNIKSESQPKSEEELMKLLTFVDLEKHLENITKITDTYVFNHSDIKIIFMNILKLLDSAYKYYITENQFIPQMQIILYMSKAYKCYAHFEGNKSKQIQLIKKLIRVIEHAIDRLSEYQISADYTFKEFFKKLYFELAITYSTLLDMTCEKFSEMKEITDEMEMEYKQLIEKITNNFNLFI